MKQENQRNGSDWKTAYRSFYYANAEEPDDIKLDPSKTALLVIDIQNTYMLPKESGEETQKGYRPKRHDRVGGESVKKQIDVF